MAEKRSFARRTLTLIGFGLLAFAITTLAGGVWSALLVTNLQSSPLYLGLSPRWGFCCGWHGVTSAGGVGHAAHQTHDAAICGPTEDRPTRTCGHGWLVVLP